MRNTRVPAAAEIVEARRMENLARFRRLGSVKAMEAMKMDMVKPIPPSMPVAASSRGEALPGMSIWPILWRR